MWLVVLAVGAALQHSTPWVRWWILGVGGSPTAIIYYSAEERSDVVSEASWEGAALFSRLCGGQLSP